MVDRDIAEYILKNSKRGFSFERIKQSLLAQGKSDYDIHEAKRFIDGGESSVPEKRVKIKKSFLHSRFFKIALVFLIILSIFLIILGLTN